MSILSNNNFLLIQLIESQAMGRSDNNLSRTSIYNIIYTNAVYIQMAIHWFLTSLTEELLLEKMLSPT